MSTPGTLVTLNPHNRLSIFHKYGTTFHSPDFALDRRSLQDTPEASAPPHVLRTRSPPDSVIIVNSENGEEKAAKDLKAAHASDFRHSARAGRS